MAKKGSNSPSRKSRPPGNIGGTRKASRPEGSSGRSDADVRRRMIAKVAYFRAEARGFEGGDPVRDWLEAEAEVDAVLKKRRGAAP